MKELKRNFRIFTAFLAVLVLFIPACSRQPRYEAPPVSENDVVVDITSLPLEVPRFYTYSVKGRNVSFFVLKLKSGVSAFFDACVSCYPQKLGYSYKDGYITCRACNMHFSIYKLEKGLGSCFPIKIDGRVKGTNYHIPLALLESHANKF